MALEVSNEQCYDIVVADYLEKMIQAMCEAQDSVFIALSGGSTPLAIFKELKNRKLSWEQLQFFRVDERTVPLNDPKSNFGTISRFFLDHISSKGYSMVQEDMFNETAIANYLAKMKGLMPFSTNGFPVFDLILLGMGDDGHTASLFPNTLALNNWDKVVVENRVPQLNTSRITFTYPTILHAEELVVLKKGQAKKCIYEEIISKNNTSYPIQKIAEKKKISNGLFRNNHEFN